MGLRVGAPPPAASVIKGGSEIRQQEERGSFEEVGVE